MRNKLRSQIGYLVMMLEYTVMQNTIIFGSNERKRVTRSVMAAEVHALILGYDFAFIIKSLVEEMLGRQVPLEIFMDSRTVLDTVAKSNIETERRFQIDLCAMKQFFDNGKMARIGWILWNKNQADELTTTNAKKTMTPLWHLMKKNGTDLDALGWEKYKCE